MSVTNATLIEVRKAPGIDDYGDANPEAAASAPLKWSGTRSAYLSTASKSVEVKGIRKTVRIDVLTVWGTLPIEVVGGEPAAADTVTVAERRAPAGLKRFRVTAVDVRGVGGPVDSIRLELANEVA